MKLPNLEMQRLRSIFEIYTDNNLIDKGVPLYKAPSLIKNAPKEAQEAFEKWKVLKKKELEEETKIGIVF